MVMMLSFFAVFVKMPRLIVATTQRECGCAHLVEDES